MVKISCQEAELALEKIREYLNKPLFEVLEAYPLSDDAFETAEQAMAQFQAWRSDALDFTLLTFMNIFWNADIPERDRMPDVLNMRFKDNRNPFMIVNGINLS